MIKVMFGKWKINQEQKWIKKYIKIMAKINMMKNKGKKKEIIR